MPSPSQPIICFGEILLRLAAQPPSILFQDDALQTSFCGAEANVAVALAGFGHHARMVSVVADNPVGAAAKSELRRHGVDIAHVAAAPGRMGLYYLSPGAMARPAHIVYDRAHSAFATLHPAALDWHDILQGAGWLFVSGINAALGEGPLTALRQAMAVAREVGVRIAFDCNYRASLWAGREHLAPGILCELASASDLVFAGGGRSACCSARHLITLTLISASAQPQLQCLLLRPPLRTSQLRAGRSPPAMRKS